MVEGFIFAGGEDVNWWAAQNQWAEVCLGDLKSASSRRLLRDQGGTLDSKSGRGRPHARTLSRGRRIVSTSSLARLRRAAGLQGRGGE